MTVPADRTYPKAAKNSEWQKKKSLGDKADPRTKSTGLGPKLEVAETRWSQIRWHQLDGSGLPADNLAEARQKLKLAVAARGAAQQVTYVLQQAGDKARTTAALTALSKPARTWASAAVTALAAASSRLNTITVQEYEDEVTRLEQLAAQRQASSMTPRTRSRTSSGSSATRSRARILSFSRSALTTASGRGTVRAARMWPWVAASTAPVTGSPAFC